MSTEHTSPQIDSKPRGPETPSDYIPSLYTLGATYDVLNGKYADSKSALQQVIDWDKSKTRTQQYGDKLYSIPDVVNYTSNTNPDYRSAYGKSVTEYSNSLSVHAGMDANFPGFSASACSDFNDSQRENLANSFTRITYLVTQYKLSLPPVSEVRQYFKPWFIENLEGRDPIEFYREYGTHMLRSLIVGGRAVFLTSTDSRTYNSSLSIEAAARISASYLVASGSMELSAAQKQAMESFNESSQTSIVTRGGDARYGNEEFLKNVKAWTASVKDFPEFIDFGSLPCFIALSELASTETRRKALREGYAQYVKLYTKDLELPGPYLRSRHTTDYDKNLDRGVFVGEYEAGLVTLKYPTNHSNEWYIVCPGIFENDDTAIITSELVPGALASVKWEKAFEGIFYDTTRVTFWRAIPPTSDYLALGCVASGSPINSTPPTHPPHNIAVRFRAIHKRALTTTTASTTPIYWTTDPSHTGSSGVIYGVDGRFISAGTVLPHEADCYKFDPKNVVEESRF